MMVVVFRP